MPRDNEQFVRFHDGVTYISIPEYRFDSSRNPFVEMGVNRERPYGIARYLDITLLHQFVIGDILICGVRSKDFELLNRKDLIRQIQESGGPPINDLSADYDFEALGFSPYISSFSTLPVFNLYHKNSPHAEKIPHYPIDIWMIFDINAYEQVSKGQVAGVNRYRLRPDYDRHSSLLSLAVIN